MPELKISIPSLRRHEIWLSAGWVLAAYLLLNLGWRDASLAMSVFLLSAPLQALAGSPLRIIWRTAFALDLGTKAFLISVYQTKPDAVLILDSISNTNWEESSEFFLHQSHEIATYALITGVFLAGLLGLNAIADRSASRRAAPMFAVALLFVGLHFNPTFRRSDPVWFWPSQFVGLGAFQDQQRILEDKRAIARSELPDWNPTYTGPARNTLALILGESTSRWNWQIYGYPRATTPQLMHEVADAMLFNDVISGANGTVASFRLMLTPKQLDNQIDDDAEPSVLMLAKAAGYKVFWISNQHDRYINWRFADEADVLSLSNVGGGRSDRGLDEVVLPAWQEALADPAPRKLIVVHLLGAHPHYELRSPPAFKKFSGVHDAVSAAMDAKDRSSYVELQRDSYDNAMLYQDMIIARLLHTFKAATGQQSGAFLYTSDHAQEVGHTRDFVGHSLDEAGCVVPLLIWRSAPTPDQARVEQRPYQTDVLDWTLLSLMDIKTRFDHPEMLLLGQKFRPRPRKIDGKPYVRSH